MRVPSKCISGLKSHFTAVVGSQWGDEGKGKLVDILAEKYDICARFNGGANAGHTIVVNGKKYALHLLPSGIMYKSCLNVLGNGVVVHLQTMFEELQQLDRDKIDYSGRLLISDRAHLVTEAQIQSDTANETDKNKRFLGTTKRGIGPTYSSKMLRFGLRVGDLLNWNIFLTKYKQLYDRFPNVKVNQEGELKELHNLRDRLIEGKMVTDTVTLMHEAIQSNKKILAEGANATMLDIDYGTYPYVTASSTNVGGICTGLGVPPQAIQTVIGVSKAYTTRVGEGPFPTEQLNDVGKYLQTKGHEFGATTGRPRRCGWIDIPVLKYSKAINGLSSINMTKIDVFTGLDELKIGAYYKLNGKRINHMPAQLEELAQVEVEYVSMPGQDHQFSPVFNSWKQDITNCKSFGEFPKELQNYVRKVEELSGIPVSWIGNGPQREKMVLIV